VDDSLTDPEEKVRQGERALAKSIRPDPSLTRYVRGIFFNSVIERLEVHHMGGAVSCIRTFKKEDLEDKNPDDIVREVQMAVQNDVQNLSGTQRYSLVVFFPEGQKPTRHYIMAEGQQVDDSTNPFANSMGEGPNQAGLVGMLMRHTEASTRTSLMASLKFMETMQKQMEMMQNREHQTMERYMHVLELNEGLVDKTYERDESRENKKAMREMGKKVLGMVEPMLPALAMSLVPGMAANSAVPALAKFAEGLTEEQMMAIVSALSPEQQEQFMGIYAALKSANEGPKK
jgi:hypothetical protein